MATSLLALLDDVTSILDDVAAMTKIAGKKSAAVLGDDLALNAQQVAGVRASRELPVVWAVAKGSMVNKAILVPAALVVSAIMPWAVTPLLIFGGAFLCYEGIEKLAHKFLHRGEEHDATTNTQGHEHEQGTGSTAAAHESKSVGPSGDLAETAVDHLEDERRKIRGAIRTDFVLSAEIVVITLGTVASHPIGTQFAVLTVIAVIMTVGVYGLVGGILKLDDLGLALSRQSRAVTRWVGRMILAAAPWLLRGLSVAGTVAIFLVGGGILTHSADFFHHWSAHLTGGLAEPLHTIAVKLFDGLIGMLLGTLALGAVTLGKRVRA